MSYPTNFVHAADIHLGKRQYDLDERFRDFASTFLKVAEYAIEVKADFVLISGDLFEQRNINAPTYVQARHVLMRLKEAGIPCIAIEGNHDRAFLRDGISWLESLGYEGLLRLIKPGGEKLMENYVDIGRIRIYGMCYAGSSTSAILPRIAQEIKEINAVDPPEYTILMMHLGVEGKANDGIIGEVSYESLLPLRECVDYLALGHYHNSYDIDGWVYNPGCPDTCSIAEVGGQKGFYHVKNGVASLKQVQGTREFYIVKVNVDGHKGIDTLEDEIERKLARISSSRPVIYIVLQGTLSFDRSTIDIERIRQIAIEKADALYADVRFDLLNDEFTVARLDSDSLDRASIEREVFRKLALADSMLAGHSDLFASALSDIKDMAVRGADEQSLDVVLRKLFDTLKGIPGGSSGPQDGEEVWDWRRRP